MGMPEDLVDLFACPACHSALTLRGEQLLCLGCRAVYPIVQGLPILVRFPKTYLQRSLDGLEEARTRVLRQLDVAESVWNKEKLPGPGLGRLKQVAAAEIITIQRVQGFLQPARLALEQMGNANIIEESLTVKVGWNLEALIPFLLRDWQPRAEKSTAMQVISSALEIAFPQGGAAIAFAGCGGGGLLESASRRFNHVIGFDLSIPILAAASELLAGQRLLLATTTSCIEGVRACEIELGPFPPASPGVSLMVTDGAATGFRTSALDGVVTQFLLDIVPDPRSVATEVYRILADGGVWLNYGPSGPRGGIWHFDARETSAFLDAAGFDVIEATTHRTTHLDNSSVDPFLSFQSHVCHLVVGRKLNRPGFPGGYLV